ncbi:DUF4873 domain-containing protein [Rhodococcus sp. HNM0569]|uniref:DUF4873 domain-containing protein n=1 Tax=Rhodococcus sp. HNM0569 TaxID=2716340 RepID=UPI003211D40F
MNEPHDIDPHAPDAHEAGHHDEPEGYRGDAEVTVVPSEGGAVSPVTVKVEFAGNFEPISGRYLWHGRVRSLGEKLAGTPVDIGTELTVTTPEGTATARVIAIDLWGSHMVEGISAPPFAWI